MAKNLYINLDEDVTKVVRKIARERDKDLTLVLPKQALLFFDPASLRLLKVQAQDLGKNLSILTMDPKGQQRAKEAGFELKTFEDLKKSGPNMDVARKVPTQAPVQAPVQKPIVAPAPAPVPSAAIVPPAIVPPIIPRAPQPGISAEPRIIAPVKAQPVRFQSRAKGKNPSRGMRNFLMLASTIAIVLIVLLTLVILPQAQITVYAHSQPISKDFQINLDANAAQPDTDHLVLPAKNISRQETLAQQFNSTGQQNLGTKAQGKIQLYNFTGRTLKLNAATTILIAGVKHYRFVSDVNNIKPTGYFSNTKNINPATLIPEVDIVSEEGGEDSNLPAGTRFEIQNSALGAQASKVYADSTTAISGGSTRFTAIVSQSDLDNASKALRDGVVAQASNELYQASGLTFPNSGTSVTVRTLDFDKNVNDQSINFTGTIDAQVVGVAYNPNDLKKMLEQRLAVTMGSDKTLDPAQEKITTSFQSFDPITGKGVLQAHIDGAIIGVIDKSAISSQIPGKDASALKEFLLSNPNIDGADVSFSPFWVKNVPKFSGKIYIDVKTKGQ